MTNVTNAVTAERATSSLMGHMNTLMGGMVMTARNTDSVTEDIAHSPAITLQSSAGTIIVFFGQEFSRKKLVTFWCGFNGVVAV